MVLRSLLTHPGLRCSIFPLFPVGLAPGPLDWLLPRGHLNTIPKQVAMGLAVSLASDPSLQMLPGPTPLGMNTPPVGARQSAPTFLPWVHSQLQPSCWDAHAPKWRVTLKIQMASKSFQINHALLTLHTSEVFYDMSGT